MFWTDRSFRSSLSTVQNIGFASLGASLFLAANVAASFITVRPMLLPAQGFSVDALVRTGSFQEALARDHPIHLRYVTRSILHCGLAYGIGAIAFVTGVVQQARLEARGNAASRVFALALVSAIISNIRRDTQSSETDTTNPETDDDIHTGDEEEEEDDIQDRVMPSNTSPFETTNAVPVAINRKDIEKIIEELHHNISKYEEDDVVVEPGLDGELGVEVSSHRLTKNEDEAAVKTVSEDRVVAGIDNYPPTKKEDEAEDEAVTEDGIEDYVVGEIDHNVDKTSIEAGVEDKLAVEVDIHTPTNNGGDEAVIEAGREDELAVGGDDNCSKIAEYLATTENDIVLEVDAGRLTDSDIQRPAEDASLGSEPLRPFDSDVGLPIDEGTYPEDELVINSGTLVVDDDAVEAFEDEYSARIDDDSMTHYQFIPLLDDAVNQDDIDNVDDIVNHDDVENDDDILNQNDNSNMDGVDY